MAIENTNDDNKNVSTIGEDGRVDHDDLEDVIIPTTPDETVFVDEEGTDLNKYKLIREDGTIEDVKLVRDTSGVTKEGTTLNAAKMNRLVSSINSKNKCYWETIVDTTRTLASISNGSSEGIPNREKYTQFFIEIGFVTNSTTSIRQLFSQLIPNVSFTDGKYCYGAYIQDGVSSYIPYYSTFNFSSETSSALWWSFYPVGHSTYIGNYGRYGVTVKVFGFVEEE
ncbi:MAG: hypothetical protein R3Y05_01370 [bacterium]